MRMISLLVTMLLVAWLVIALMGKDKGATGPAYKQMEQQTSAVQKQLDEDLVLQTKKLSEADPGGQPEQQ